MQEEKKYTMQQLLAAMVEHKASDLHITVGSPPQLRINGDLRPLPIAPLTSTDTKSLCFSVLRDKQKAEFETKSELDFSFGVRNLARFRGNLFMQRGATAGVFRLIPSVIRSFSALGLPPVIEKMASRPRGLIVVTGPTGSGKSTTLAAIIDHINSTVHKHIITIEDPIEYIHESKHCLINQREVGTDTESYPSAMRYLLRQDPDIVLLGELRDLESVETALSVAETGHLVLTTLHTNGAVATINRIVDLFPAARQEQVRVQLSFVIEGIVSQQLLPRVDGLGRVMAMEVMVPNPAIRNLIREDKIHQIYSQLQVGQTTHGMQTMNQALVNLVAQRLVSVDEAMLRCSDVTEFKTLLKNTGVALL